MIKWKADHTYDTLKKGTNKLVCDERTGDPGITAPFAAQCTSLANLERVAQNRKFAAIADKAARDKALADARSQRHAGQAGVRIRVVDDERPRPGDRANPQDGRRPGRDGKVAGAARQQSERRRLDHERGDVHGASHDPGNYKRGQRSEGGGLRAAFPPSSLLDLPPAPATFSSTGAR